MVDMRTILTIDAMDKLSNENLDQLIRDGFAYVKLPETSVEDTLWELHGEGIRFFNQPIGQKEHNDVKLNPKTLQGYVDRSKENTTNPISHEQIFFRPSQPLGQFEPLKSQINKVHNCFWFDIAKPLLNLIFHRVLQPLHFESKKINQLSSELTNDIFPSISFLHYPASAQSNKCELGLNEHRDQGLATVLWINQEGLQVWLENPSDSSDNGEASGIWCNINPKPGYVVVNLANALQLILGNRCNSALHRVLLPQKDRLSIAIFYDPSFTYNIRNIITDELIFGGSYGEYLKAQFAKTKNPSFVDSLNDFTY